MGQLIQISENAYPNTYSEKLDDIRKGVTGATMLSQGRLFTQSHDGKFRISKQDSSNAIKLDLQAENLQAKELPDGRILCWTKRRIIILSSEGKSLTNIKIKDDFKDVFVLSSGRFFPIVGLQNEPILYEKNGEPIRRLTTPAPNTEVCGATELPNGKFITWTDCFPNNHIWNPDGTHDREFNCHSLEQYSVTVISKNRFLSVAADGIALICDLDGDILFELQSTSNIYAAYELSDGRFLADSEDEDGKTWWHYFSSKGDLQKTIDPKGIYASPILNLANDFYLSLTDGRRNSAMIWTGDCEIIGQLHGHTHRITGAIQLRDFRIVTWSEDTTIRVWDKNGNALGVLQGHTDAILEVLELDSGRLLSTSVDGHTFVWDAANAGPIKDSHLKDIDGILQLDNGSLLTWSNAEGIIKIWDQTGQPIKSGKAGETHTMRGVKRLRNGQYVSWGSGQFNRIFSQKFDYSHQINGYSGEKIWSYYSTEKICQLDNGWIVSSVRNKFHITDIDGISKGSFEAFRYTPLGIQSLRDGRLLSYGDGVFFIHDANGNLIAKIQYDGLPRVLEDGRILDSRSFKYFNTDGEETRQPAIPSGSWCVKQLDDERLVVTCKDQVFFYSVDGEYIADFPRHSKSSMGLHELPDGCLVTYGTGPELVLRKSSGELLSTLNGHDGIILGVSHQQNGNIVSWDSNKTMRLWSSEGNLLASKTFTHTVQQVLPLVDDASFAVAAANEIYILKYEPSRDLFAKKPSNPKGVISRLSRYFNKN